MPLPPLSSPASWRCRLGAVVGAAPSVVFLTATLLAFNLLQSLSLIVLPLSGRLFRAINRWAADTWWGWCVIVGQRVYGVRLVVTGDDVPCRENAVVVANHQQMPDIAVLMALARSKQRLGDLKWFVKKPIKYVPGVGWGMAFLDCLFVSRTWTADRASIEQTFARLLAHRVPLWLISFVEGTRISTAKLQRAATYATQLQVPAPKHVLIPRTKGFVASVQGLRTHIDAVYDVTIGYEQGVPSLWQYMLGFARVAHLHVRRYPVAGLPTEDEHVAAWLLERFREKDQLLDRYYESGVLA